MEHFHYNDAPWYCLENWDTIECIVGWNQDNLHRDQIQDAAEFQASSTFEKILKSLFLYLQATKFTLDR